jgi:hypothetical protein
MTLAAIHDLVQAAYRQRGGKGDCGAVRLRPRDKDVMRFDIKTVSEANQRGHWSARSKRKKSQQRDFSILWKQQKCVVELPAVITFTRYSHKTMDTDNLAGAFKAIRDQLARELGIDDGSEQIRFEYAQERTPKMANYFTVEVK